jgi:hypothetical protein
MRPTQRRRLRSFRALVQQWALLLGPGRPLLPLHGGVGCGRRAHRVALVAGEEGPWLLEQVDGQAHRDRNLRRHLWDVVTVSECEAGEQV